MKALILDAGNSRTKLFLWEGDRQGPRFGTSHPLLLEEVQHWETPDRQGDWNGLQERIAATCARYPGRPLVVASVIPEVLAGLEELVPELRVADHRSDLPFASEPPDLAAVGADRFCNLAAVASGGLTSALVVDAGTATTIDLLIDGVFLGGLIAPGPEFALRRLGESAARLEPVAFAPAPLEPGRDTATAMARGAWNTGIGGINWCIDGLGRRYGNPPIVLTGGLGRHLQAEGRFFDPHLTLRGAAALAGLLG